MRKQLNLPNQLTLSRILMVPVVLIFLHFGGVWTSFFAGFFFALAGFTDLIDGYLARKNKEITMLGKFLDPLADKMLVSSVLIMMVYLERVAAWIVIIIICRDIMVTGLRAIAADEGIVIAADKYGKLKTLLQLVALEPLILHYTWLGLPMHDIGIFLLYISLALTVFSGYNYVRNFYRDWRQKHAARAEQDGTDESAGTGNIPGGESP
ncbi:CDP-diacylglycerol--glycerol-3-phosphate 3-phosphatidyltransferase [Desulfovibrio sp. OttesenSCG-928-A18]|nr:CDP-diacylglycerol--glycerol-3-phosphate 3-phosphatidyltransferase [Desulfovibrio sp. OttesenSCG-928-A18]